MTRWPLNEIQQKIFDFIVSYVGTKGYPPSIREISVHAQLNSTSSVAHQLRQIARKGYIRRDAGVPRGIQVLP